MKVTIDLTKLLRDGTISQQEYDRMIELSKKDTKSHAVAIFMVLAVIAVMAGTVGLFPNFFTDLGMALFDLFGARGLHLLAISLSGIGAVLANSGFLAALCAIGILTFIGDSGVFYTHATYFVGIKEPAMTVLFFAVLAYISYAGSQLLEGKHQRLTVIFSRTCLFIVNMAFWIGSLWGSKLGDRHISDLIFSIGWAIVLVGVGVWAATQNKRWVVNTVAVFGSIHFYTQWFERLGASPGSLLSAGIVALGILYGFKEYNQLGASLKN